MMKQGTPEWFKERLGKATASRVADICAKTKSGPAASRGNYLLELVTERLTGEPTPFFVNSPGSAGSRLPISTRTWPARRKRWLLPGTKAR